MRLVQMMRNVYACTWKHGESTGMYAGRFESLAPDYLNDCDANAAVQDSQNFGMLLIENSKIPASVYSTVITHLVATASARDGEENEIYLIGKAKHKSIRDKVDTAKATLGISE